MDANVANEVQYGQVQSNAYGSQFGSHQQIYVDNNIFEQNILHRTPWKKEWTIFSPYVEYIFSVCSIKGMLTDT